MIKPIDPFINETFGLHSKEYRGIIAGNKEFHLHEIVRIILRDGSRYVGELGWIGYGALDILPSGDSAHTILFGNIESVT